MPTQVSSAPAVPWCRTWSCIMESDTVRGMKNWLFLSAVSVATVGNCATHQAGKPVANSSVPSPCPGSCPPGPTAAPAEARVPEPAPPVADDVERHRIPLEGPFHGAVNAKVNIVVFSDFQCPFCARAAETMRLLIERYPSDVRLYFRHLPLSFHVDASLAAQAAMAADAQGKFWQMHDKLFANQEHLKRADLEAYARDIGLDLGRFKQDLDHPTWKNAVAADAALASQMGVVGTPNFFINGRPLRGALPIDTFQGVIEEELARSKKLLAAGTPPEGLYARLMAGARTGPPPPPASRPPVSNEVYRVQIDETYRAEIEGAPVKGAMDALVTIVEFSDFQCPFCAQVEPTIKKILAEYKGQVRVVWRDLPLAFHANAKPAAIAARAANQQGKFWPMHDILLKNQENLDAADLEKYAKAIGLNMTKFKAALQDKKLQDAVEADAAMADRIGARGTPSFYVNGKFLSGAQPLETFKSKIDEELDRAKKLVAGGTPKADVYAVILKGARVEVPKPAPAAPSPAGQHAD